MCLNDIEVASLHFAGPRSSVNRAVAYLNNIVGRSSGVNLIGHQVAYSPVRSASRGMTSCESRRTDFS